MFNNKFFADFLYEEDDHVVNDEADSYDFFWWKNDGLFVIDFVFKSARIKKKEEEVRLIFAKKNIFPFAKSVGRLTCLTFDNCCLKRMKKKEKKSRAIADKKRKSDIRRSWY